MGRRIDPPSDERRPHWFGAMFDARSAPGNGRGTPEPDPRDLPPSSLPQLWSRGAPSTSQASPTEEHCPLSPADPLDRVAFQLLLPPTDRSPAASTAEEI
jgi:hypothetical protein